MLEQCENDKGCQCHYNIRGITNQKAREIYILHCSNNIPDFRLCDDNGFEKPICFDDDHELLLNKSDR